MGMKERLVGLSAAVVLGASAVGGAAFAQEALDAKDPSVTARPKIDLERTPQPDYPEAAASAGLEGDVRLTTCVDVQGRAYTGQVTTSSGHAVLDDATMAWLANVRFSPAQANGAPVAVCNYPMVYEWRLESDTKLRDVLTKEPTLTREARPPEFPEGVRVDHAEAVVSLCLDIEGKVLSAKIVKSSGERKLDDSVIDWVLRGARFSPAEVNGAPSAVCNYEFTHVWNIKR